MTDLSLRYLLFGEDRTASSSMKKVGTEAESVGTRVSNSMQKIGEGVAVATAAAAALSVHNALAMQESDARIQGSAQISSAAAKSIGDAFLATAGTSTFSGKAMADAFGPVAGVIQEVAGHALTTADSMTVMNASTMLAEATGNALGATTSDLAAVMQSYGIKIGGAAAASNILFNASRLTNVPLDTLATTVDKLHGKLGIAAPTLTDVSGLMVDLANHGISGSKGLMVVNSGLTTLMGGSKATTAELKTLGINIFDSSGKFVGMKGVLEQLTPKLKDMTQQQQFAAEKALFGSGAAKALNSTILAGVAGFTNSTAAVTKHGAAEDAAKAKAGTLQGQTKILTAAFTDITTQLGQKLIPIITNVVTWFDKNRTASMLLAGIVGGILLAATIAWAAAMIAGTWPILAVIAVLALLVAGVVYAWNHFETFRLIVTAAWVGIQVIATFVWNSILKPIFALMVDGWSRLATGVMWAWNNLIHPAWVGMQTAVGFLWNSVLKPTFKFIIDAFLNLAGAIINAAANAFGWVPGLGDKLRTAAAHFNTFRDNVNASLNGITGKTVSVGVSFSAGSGGLGSGVIAPGVVKGRTITGAAMGGPITGGIPGQDSVLRMLMPNEYVVRADGSNLGDAMAHYGFRGMANGGLVVKTSIPSASGISGAVNSGFGSFVNGLDFSGLLSSSTAGGGGAGGAAQWSSLVAMVLMMLGQPASSLAGNLRRINLESGGNPNAINLTDSNARAGHPSQGLMQTIPSTFAAYAGPFAHRGITDPLANIYAGDAYGISRYGSVAAIDPLVHPGGYDQGGGLAPGLTMAYNGTGQMETVSPPGAPPGGPLTLNLVVNGQKLATAVLPDLQRLKGSGVNVNLG